MTAAEQTDRMSQAEYTSRDTPLLPKVYAHRDALDDCKQHRSSPPGVVATVVVLEESEVLWMQLQLHCL